MFCIVRSTDILRVCITTILIIPMIPHEAAKYIHLDVALRIRDYLKSEYDEDYHIELISDEG